MGKAQGESRAPPTPFSLDPRETPIIQIAPCGAQTSPKAYSPPLRSVHCPTPKRGQEAWPTRLLVTRKSTAKEGRLSSMPAPPEWGDTRRPHFQAYSARRRTVRASCPWQCQPSRNLQGERKDLGRWGQRDLRSFLLVSPPPPPMAPNLSSSVDRQWQRWGMVFTHAA